MRLQGKVALISGGRRGMGAVEAASFAQAGANVGAGVRVVCEQLQVEPTHLIPAQYRTRHRHGPRRHGPRRHGLRRRHGQRHRIKSIRNE